MYGSDEQFIVKYGIKFEWFLPELIDDEYLLGLKHKQGVIFDYEGWFYYVYRKPVLVNGVINVDHFIAINDNETDSFSGSAMEVGNELFCLK